MKAFLLNRLTNVGFSDGVGFARACLPIGKNCGVETMKEGFNEGLNAVGVHILLGQALLKDKVTVEVAVIAQGDPPLLRVCRDAALMVVQNFFGQKWSHPDGHLHGSFLHLALADSFWRHR